MILTINGEPREVAATTVLDLLEELGLHQTGMGDQMCATVER